MLDEELESFEFAEGVLVPSVLRVLRDEVVQVFPVVRGCDSDARVEPELAERIRDVRQPFL